jgi:hypothetical protein
VPQAVIECSPDRLLISESAFPICAPTADNTVVAATMPRKLFIDAMIAVGGCNTYELRTQSHITIGCNFFAPAGTLQPAVMLGRWMMEECGHHLSTT